MSSVCICERSTENQFRAVKFCELKFTSLLFLTFYRKLTILLSSFFEGQICAFGAWKNWHLVQILGIKWMLLQNNRLRIFWTSNSCFHNKWELPVIYKTNNLRTYRLNLQISHENIIEISTKWLYSESILVLKVKATR